jgi:hypothetical protein
MEDMIAWNKSHSATALPEGKASHLAMRLHAHILKGHSNQDDLIRARYNNTTYNELEKAKSEMHLIARDTLDMLFEQQNINLLACPSDSSFCIWAAAAGTFIFSSMPTVQTLRLMCSKAIL